MSRNVIHCVNVLTGAGWRQGVNLQLGAGGLIESMEPGAAPDGAIHLAGPVVPGMPNLHSHAFQRAIAGSTGRKGGTADSFWTWREAMYGLANRIGPEQLEHIAAWLYVEMLEAGYTACAEFHYVHHDIGGKVFADQATMANALMAAAERVGMPLLLLPVLYCRSGFGEESTSPAQARFGHSPAGFAALFEALLHSAAKREFVEVGVAPHSLRAVSASDLQAMLERVPRTVPVHIHIAEQPAEVQQCLAATGQRPVEYLMDRFEVDGRWCLVHATHLSAGERVRAAASGAVAGLCPTTEADLGDGIFPIDAWLDAGGAFGVGSDSNVRVSAAEELRLLEYGARLSSGQRNVLGDEKRSCGHFAWEVAARGGAAALGQATGTIEPGRRADLVELNPDHPLLAGKRFDEVLDGLVFAEAAGMIRCVLTAGRVRVSDGRHSARESCASAMRATLAELRTNAP